VVVVTYGLWSCGICGTETRVDTDRMQPIQERCDFCNRRYRSRWERFTDDELDNLVDWWNSAVHFDADRCGLIAEIEAELAKRAESTGLEDDPELASRVLSRISNAHPSGVNTSHQSVPGRMTFTVLERKH
jgi:hypothetical protein